MDPKRRNSYQDSIFLNFMQKYPKLATSTYRNKALVTTLWHSLAGMLNANGPQRHVNQWRKAWADWKNYVRKKVLENKIPLSPGEEIIAKVCNYGDVANRNRICGYDEPNEEGHETEKEAEELILYSSNEMSAKTRNSSPALSKMSSILSLSQSRSRSPTHTLSSSRSRSPNRSRSPTRSLSPSQSRSPSPRSLRSQNSSLTKSKYSSSSKKSFHSKHSSKRYPSSNKKITTSNVKFEQVPCNSSSIKDSKQYTRIAIRPDLMFLPEEDTNPSQTDDCNDDDNNLTKLFKKQINALNALVEKLDKNISTQMEVLKTAKVLNNEFKSLNENIKQLTERINGSSNDDYIRNRRIELLQMKKNLLTQQLRSLENEKNIHSKYLAKDK